MFLTPVNVNLANSKYTYINKDSIQCCGGYANVFDIKAKKVDIMYDLLNQINNGNTGLIYKEGLIAIFSEHKANNEDYNYFEIFEYINGYNEEDYRTSGNKTYGFGFIENKVV